MKHRLSSSPLLLGLLAAAVGGACAPQDDGAEVVLSFGHLPQAASTPCSTTPQDTSVYIEDVDALRLRVSGPGMKTMQKTYSKTAGELAMDKVPVGSNRSVMVTGLKSTLSLWRGTASGIKVDANKSSTANVFLTRVADLTCARNPLQDGRAFHTTTRLPDGKLLIVGGVNQDLAAAGCQPSGGVCRNLTATDTVDIYDPQTGQIAATGALSRPRAFHAAAVTADGKVVVVGGASSARFNSLAPFPIVPDAAIKDIEVYDPASGTWSVVGMDPEPTGRAFAAGVTLPSGANAGSVLFSGGGTPALANVPDPATPSQNTATALRSSILCTSTGGAVSCAAGPDMEMRRAGHVMAAMGDGRVLVFGGSIERGTDMGLDDSGNMRQVGRQAPEYFNGDAFVFPKNRPDYPDGSNRVNNMFFATAVPSPAWGGVFIVGGLIRNDDDVALHLQDPEAAAQLRGETARGAVWFFAEDVNYVVESLNQEDKLQLQTPRYFVGAAALGEGGNFVAAGGLRGNLTVFESSDALDLFDADRAAFKTISVGGVARPIRQKRGGVTATALPGGTAIFIGGTSEPGTVAQTAEVFTDTQESQ